MTNASHSTRQSFLRGSVLTLAALSPLGARQTQEARAGKNVGKKPLSIAQRTNGFIAQCVEIGGAAKVVSVKPGGTTVSCTHDDGTGITCTYSKKKSRCHASATHPGDVPNLQPDRPTADPGDLPDVPLVPA